MLSHVLRRQLSSTANRRSPHALWYASIVPSMVPIALLGSTVYIALQLLQTHLSRERYLDHARAHVAALERELDELRRAPPEPHHHPTSKTTPRSWFS